MKLCVVHCFMDDEFYFSTFGTGAGVIKGNKRSSLPSLKRTTLPGVIGAAAPVRGLRAMPVLRGRTLKIPKPRSSMRSPRAKASFMLSNTAATAISAFVFVMPVLNTTSFTMSSLIKVAPSSQPASLKNPSWACLRSAAVLVFYL